MESTLFNLGSCMTMVEKNKLFDRVLVQNQEASTEVEKTESISKESVENASLTLVFCKDTVVLILETSKAKF